MFTHMKRPYRAQAIQWDSSNTSEIMQMLSSTSRLYNGKLMLKHKNGDFSTLSPTDWVVKGENGEVKRYSDEVFNTKYTGWDNEIRV